MGLLPDVELDADDFSLIYFDGKLRSIELKDGAMVKLKAAGWPTTGRLPITLSSVGPSGARPRVIVKDDRN